MLSSEAEDLILKGKAPAGLRISGFIDLSGKNQLRELPADLTVDVLSVANCRELKALPPGLKVRRLTLDNCASLTSLPPDLKCAELQWHNCHWEEWPEGISIKNSLDLSSSPFLESLPEALSVAKLRLNDCVSVTSLPENISTCFLEMRGCRGFRTWPKHGSIDIGRIILRDCIQLRELPHWLTRIGQLDLRNCALITSLPNALEITSWIDIGGTGIRSLPAQVADNCLRWRGVPVNRRIVFDSQNITSTEILEENNVEKRRVMLELKGYDAFLKEADAVVLDEDKDTGGARRLFKVPMPGDEDLVCVSVICPSTQRQYIIRVPPTMKTCHQSAAWIAGFDKEDDYVLVGET
jgi:hypothetical protein